MSIVERGGLHYVDGLPGWVEYLYRGGTFVACVVAFGLLLGVLRGRQLVDRGLWWVALAGFIVVAMKAIVALERWVVPLTVEGILSSLALPALLYGMWLRVRSGTVGR